MTTSHLREGEFEKWFDLWDTTKDPEVKRLCGIAWRVARDTASTQQHAVAEPQVTPSVWTITEEAAKHSHFCYHKDSDEWKCSCGEVLSKYVMPYDERRKLNSLDSEMAFVRFNHKDHFRFVLHGLLITPAHAAEQPKLTEEQAVKSLHEWLEAKRVELSAEQLWAVESYLVLNVLPIAAPVAPPPQADPWFKPYANCDWCGQATHDERLFGKSCRNGEGGFMREACKGTYRLNPIFEKPTSAPSLAPGEQQPPTLKVPELAPGEESLIDTANLVTQVTSEIAIYPPPVPPMQERESDEVEFRDTATLIALNTAGFPPERVADVICDALATAAKQARLDEAETGLNISLNCKLGKDANMKLTAGEVALVRKAIAAAHGEHIAALAAQPEQQKERNG